MYLFGISLITDFILKQEQKATKQYYEAKLQEIKSDFELKEKNKYINRLSKNYFDFILNNKILLLRSRFLRFLGYFFLFLFFITFFFIVRNIFNRFVLKKVKPSSL